MAYGKRQRFIFSPLHNLISYFNIKNENKKVGTFFFKFWILDSISVLRKHLTIETLQTESYLFTTKVFEIKRPHLIPLPLCHLSSFSYIFNYVTNVLIAWEKMPILISFFFLFLAILSPFCSCSSLSF